MVNYHGIIIDISQKDKFILDRLKVLSKKKVGNWVLHNVEVKPNNIDKIIKDLQENMIDSKFYFHFYRNDELIIIFKNKIFRVNTDKSSWKDAIECGKKLGIPKEQLDFYPYRIEDEKYWI